MSHVPKVDCDADRDAGVVLVAVLTEAVWWWRWGRECGA